MRGSGDLFGVYRRGGVGASCWAGDSGGCIGNVSASYSRRACTALTSDFLGFFQQNFSFPGDRILESGDVGI